MKKAILRYPRLDTLLMLEKFIKEHGGEYKRKSLWKALPKKMMYQTYKVAIDYLEESLKIAIDREGHICWIYNPELARKLLKNSVSTESIFTPEVLRKIGVKQHKENRLQRKVCACREKADSTVIKQQRSSSPLQKVTLQIEK